jgi:segregation and condensation protein A
MPTASLPFSITLPAYDGPLDLLLDLVRKQEVRIEDISVSLVAAQFLAYVEKAADVNIDLSAEWIDMAARLILWKSRSLLPQDPEICKSAPDFEAELVGLLKKHARAAAEVLIGMKDYEDSSFSRAETEAIEPLGNEQDAFFSLWDLIQLCEDHARDSSKAERYAIATEIVPEEVSVDGMISWIRRRLEAALGQPVAANALFSERPRLPERICTFLAMLELARQQAIELTQIGPLTEFGPILLLRKQR